MEVYDRINFKDFPEKKTPIGARNLNHMEKGIYDNSVEINNLQKNINNELSALKSKDSSFESQISSLNTKANSNSTKIGNVESDVSKSKSDIGAITSALNTLSFARNNSGEWGYKVGASSEIIPFSSTKVFRLGSGSHFDVKQLCPNSYRSLTSENFIISTEGASFSGYVRGSAGPLDGSYSFGQANFSAAAKITKSYDSVNGILTVTNENGTGSARAYTSGLSDKTDAYANATVRISSPVVYLVIGKIN